MRLGFHNGSLVLAVCVGVSACQAASDQDGMDFAVGAPAAGGGLAGTLAPAGTGASGMVAAGIGGGSGTAAGASGLGGVSGAAGSAAGSSAGGGGGAAGTASGAGGASAAGSGGGAGQAAIPTERFSFFVTSMEAMLELSESDQGFGGDLRFGEATGLAGADKICATIADRSLPGASGKQWRAFLSAAAGGPSAGPVHAKDRIGSGPWYDRMGRLVAMNLSGLLQTRPSGADALIANDLPNEHGEPNHQGVDNHDTVTASNESGEYDGGDTCEDWTNAPPLEVGDGGMPMFGGGEHNGPGVGHSWPANSGQSWMAAHRSGGCAAGVNLVQNGGGSGNGIGAGGGYGGFYCFALMP